MIMVGPCTTHLPASHVGVGAAHGHCDTGLPPAPALDPPAMSEPPAASAPPMPGAPEAATPASPPACSGAPPLPLVATESALPLAPAWGSPLAPASPLPPVAPLAVNFWHALVSAKNNAKTAPAVRTRACRSQFTRCKGTTRCLHRLASMPSILLTPVMENDRDRRERLSCRPFLPIEPNPELFANMRVIFCRQRDSLTPNGLHPRGRLEASPCPFGTRALGLRAGTRRSALSQNSASRSFSLR